MRALYIKYTSSSPSLGRDQKTHKLMKTRRIYLLLNLYIIYVEDSKFVSLDLKILKINLPRQYPDS